MDVQHQVRADIQSPKATPHRLSQKRTRRTVVLLSAGALGLAALGAAAIRNHDSELSEGASGLVMQKASAALPAGNNLRSASAANAPLSKDRLVSKDRLADRFQYSTHLVSVEAAPEGGREADVAGPAPVISPFGIGDRLKITLYERVESEDDKWGRASSALHGFQQRPELSGEYAVEEDGTISVPLLGSFLVTASSEQQVEAALAETFEKAFERRGIVNVQLIARPPVYVLGPVKNPGSYKYVPGMTVLHAIALAGGVDRSTIEPWQKVEGIRELQRRTGAFDAMQKLIAREAVLKAERDGTTPKAPTRLVELVGPTAAASLVDQQSDQRKAIAIARRERARAVRDSAESAKQDLLVYAGTDSLNELVKLRQDRVENARSLVDRGLLGKQALSQLQSELADAEQRRKDTFNQYSLAKQRLAEVQSEALRVSADLQNDLGIEIENTQRQIADSERDVDASQGILNALPSVRAHFETANKEGGRIVYRIVRQTKSGPISIDAGGMAVLQPGDLVNIVTTADPAERMQLDPATPKPSGETPIKRASNPQDTVRSTTLE